MGELLLVRHGQASFGADNYDKLSAQGIQQGELLGKYFEEREIVFTHTACGDLVRHRETIDAIAGEMHSAKPPAPYIFPGINEYKFQSLTKEFMRNNPSHELVVARAKDTGGDTRAYYRLFKFILNQWTLNELNFAPEESWGEFYQRVNQAREKIELLADEGQRVLVVGSGGSISAIIGQVLGLNPEKIVDLNLQIKNTSISRFFVGKDKTSLASFNETPHFASAKAVKMTTFS